jgi:hypothetical protein
MSDFQDFVGSHGVGAGIGGITAEGAVSAVVPAEIREREENLARVGDDAGLESFFGGAGGGQEFGQIGVGAGDELKSGGTGDGDARADIGEDLLLRGEGVDF